MRRLALVDEDIVGGMTVRCDGCKYWGRKSAVSEAHICTRMMHFGDFETPTEPTWMFGALHTAADFGCALFELHERYVDPLHPAT